MFVVCVCVCVCWSVVHVYECKRVKNEDLWLYYNHTLCHYHPMLLHSIIHFYFNVSSSSYIILSSLISSHLIISMCLQMLFYESAKCLHGRMKEFKGQYYGSIFLHYSPVDKSIWDYKHDVRYTQYSMILYDTI